MATCGGEVASGCLKKGALRLFAALGFAFGDDSGMETAANLVGKRVDLVVAVDLDGLLGSIADDVAITAPHQVLFEVRLQCLVDGAVEVIGKFF